MTIPNLSMPHYLPIVIPHFFFWFRTTGVSGRFYIELFEPQVHKGKDSHPGGVLLVKAWAELNNMGRIWGFTWILYKKHWIYIWIYRIYF